MSILEELKRRNVAKVAALYVIASWLMLQIADVGVSLLSLPAWVGKTVFLFLVLGFPFVLIFSWVYEMTQDGLMKEKDIDRSQSSTPETGRKINIVIFVLLIVAVGYFAFDKFVLDPARDAVEIEAAVKVAQEQEKPNGSASVAVLPFVNLSNDAQQGFFSDGIADEIIGLLSQVDGLRVTARTSTFLFKDRTQDIRDIGKSLGVANVLDGSVRRSGNQLRITAQLVDVETGFGIWSASFDREFEDVFAIQRAVAMEVLLAVKGAGLADSVEPQPVDIDVYEDYLKSRSLLRDERPETVTQAKRLLEILVIKAPDDPRVHAALAQAIILDSDQQYGDTPLADAAARAREHIRVAQQLSPTLSDAYSVEGLLALFEGSFELATASFERATALSPGDALPWHWLYFAKKELGEIGPAREALLRAAELDPLFPATVQHYAFAFADVRLDEVTALLGRFESRWPGHPVIDISRANIAFRQGELDIGHSHILDYCDKVGYEFGVCAEAQINVYFQLGMYDELAAISQRAIQPPLLDAFLCPVTSLLPLTALAAFRSNNYVEATDLWTVGFESNPDGRARMLGASYAAAAGEWTTVREILEPETSFDVRASLIELHPSHERFALADLAIARREEGDEQGALVLINELKAYRAEILSYHERRLFPTRTLHLMDMTIAAAQRRGDEALESYANAYAEGFRFRSPEGEPLLAPWRERPRFLELQATYDADATRMRRNVREQLARHEQGSASPL
jgi:TolB-like protein/tetratricopeptide (TPR) repeat protein